MAERRPDRTLGPPHDMFWEWCAKGELRIQRCGDCHHLNWPAVATCDHCGGGALEWERMGGGGRIVSDCVFERDYYGGMLPMPWRTLLVALDEGPLFVSNPADRTGAAPAVGERARLAFVACEDGAGPFQLPVFAPADDPS